MFLGTFSKIFCPGLRLGWVAASKDVVSEYVKIKQSADLHTSNFDQGIADAYMENYDLDKHVEEIKALYKKTPRSDFKNYGGRISGRYGMDTS